METVFKLKLRSDFEPPHVSQWSLTLCPDGAALFHVSVKEEKNCDLLYKYLVHRIYGFPFATQAYVVEKDSVFMWVKNPN